MIGIDINVPNKHGNYLYKIFSGINVLNYEWDIMTDDFICYENGKLKEGLFGAKDLTREGFLKCISRDKYYMIFADIKAYPLGSTHVEIETIKDFLKSDCAIIILWSDSSFVEFYCKDKQILE